jgi:diaminohydroxyphosphoribosylaminopyrimidine deaminase/5-amino-6-(5-phosphoribosylamino)uracil reductase
LSWRKLNSITFAFIQIMGVTGPEIYMRRCLELALRGLGHVAPNPMVGAVLVYEDRIIAEGYHKQFGKPHAEVNCINAVSTEDERLLEHATLYVSLEPCAHHGKTPPCADLILEKKIPRVVVGCRDPFEKVNGKGIEKLRQGAVEVEVGCLEKECVDLNKRFFNFHLQHRPYIIVKWAQSNNARMANTDHSRVFISNEFTNRLVHKWRSEESAVLVGTNTALHDDPALTVRLWKGKQPVRLVIDMDLSLPRTHKIFNTDAHTIIFNTIKQGKENQLSFYQITADLRVVHQIVHALYQLQLQSVIVEGGAKLLQSFIDEGMWDEARIITNEEVMIDHGLPSPTLTHYRKLFSEQIRTDRIQYYHHS